MFFVQDAVDPITFPSLVIDRVLQVALLLAIPCALTMLVPTAWVARLGAISSAVAGLALSATVAMTGLLRPEADPGVIWLAVGGVAGCLTLLIWQGRRIERVRKAPLAIGAGLAAASLSLVQFWQSASFLPSQTEAALAQEISSTVVVTSKTQLKTDIDLKLTNETNSRVLVIVSSLVACHWPSNEKLIFDTYKLRFKPECSKFRPVTELSYLSARSSVTWRTALTVPKERPRLQIITEIAFARGDRLRTGRAMDRGNLGECYDVHTVQIDEESRYKGLAQPDKYLVYADRSRDGGKNYYLQFHRPNTCYTSVPEGRKKRPIDNTDSELARYFGVTESRQVTVQWLKATK